ncbi:MAG: DEAD/DEAH box helicase, partial [Clostridia bacterium]|nr:DEAD/DEAH box helicase [Clostridia bacterium]
MDKNVKTLTGVGEKKYELLQKIGVTTVGDLLSLTPRRYEDIGGTVNIDQLAANRGNKVSIIAQVTRPVVETRISGGRILTTVYAEDDTGCTKIIFFNNPYIKNTLKQYKSYLFYGKIPESGPPQFTAPEIYQDPYNMQKTLLPIYPLTTGLNQKFLRKIMKVAISDYDPYDPLPSELRARFGLCDKYTAVGYVHFPDDNAQIEKGRHRIIFEELLYYSLGLRYMKKRGKRASRYVVRVCPTVFMLAHPFKPTAAHKKAIDDIARDMASGYAMNRLLQGDVGSGKTYVAGQCAYSVIKSGAQAVIMVPTEVLANQHYAYFKKMFEPLGISTALLTSSVRASAKRSIKKDIADGSVRFVVGTHA